MTAHWAQCQPSQAGAGSCRCLWAWPPFSLHRRSKWRPSCAPASMGLAQLAAVAGAGAGGSKNLEAKSVPAAENQRHPRVSSQSPSVFFSCCFPIQDGMIRMGADSIDKLRKKLPELRAELNSESSFKVGCMFCVRCVLRFLIHCHSQYALLLY